mmetsp:Transcript_27252/g.46033  ORF Transcript_27252/g.46033 Transcript_27252/m.46033 type:complete len:563 (+) Transcript_27252:125-1813(+)|eukprot:CAMPEP_0114475532 /NCGR_PEP_ID=MMETSP0104-20121206/14201_1 /TAXON_ID=37642 ORGANISM="Paraphysomonas imperforata, Strain PA2" /NCGR_SAMPLE_ID=MMETSP0104 /ASSEMBLY_ACC=CAM_ASM_000202 /LENGTH=562 /DNA_ID=CAMNT_0001650061 /DNA_START=31 /DNA_END=1719 /DNA_ORIENTATION=+
MSRKTRRKTLSHAEIENFLCDLGNDSPEVMKSTAMETVTVVTESISSSSDCENQITSSYTSIVNEKEDEKCYRARIVRAFHKDLTSGAKDPNTEATGSLTSYAKIIHEKTEYPLLPKRQIYPEKYQHSITSLESKKALLLSMQPMLSAAEKQRKIDSEVLEEFTRCKVGKSRARPSTYEYLDFDTNMRISGKEYSRRYLLCLAKKKTAGSGVDISAASSQSEQGQQEQQLEKPPKGQLVLQDISVNFENSNSSTCNSSSSPEKRNAKAVPAASSTDLDFLMSFDDEDSGNVRKKERSRGRSGSRSRREESRGAISRRRTLSPASTKAILQQEIEDTIAGETNEQMETTTQENVESLTGDEIIPNDVEETTNMDVAEDVIDDIEEKNLRRSSSGKKRSLQSGGGSGLESLQSPFKVQLQSSSPVMQMLEVSDKEVEQQQDATIDHFADLGNMDVPVAVKPLALQSIGSGEMNDEEVDGTIKDNAGDVIMDNQETSAFCDKPVVENTLIANCAGVEEQEPDEETQEEKAYARYELRLEVAKWKYFWEMASEGAARVAASRISWS